MEEEEEEEEDGPKPRPIFLKKDEKIEVALRDIPEEIEGFHVWLKQAKSAVAVNGARPFELERWFEQSYAPGVYPSHLAVDEDSPCWEAKGGPRIQAVV